MAGISTATAVETGRHLHRCQHCGVIWGHGNMMGDDVEAHKCPKCGKQEWRPFSGGQAATREEPAKRQTLQTLYVVDLRTLVKSALLVATVYLAVQLIVDWLTGESIDSLGLRNGGS